MIIQIDGYQGFKINEHQTTIMGTNNYTFFKDLTASLRGYNESSLLYSDNYKTIQFEDNFDVDTSILYSRQLNDKYKSLLLKYVIKQLTDEEICEINIRLNQIEQYISSILFGHITDLEINRKGDVYNFFKYLNIQIPSFMSDEPYDIMETDVKLHKEIKINKILVFENVHNLLSYEQINQIIHLSNDLEVGLFLIEFTEKDSMKNYKNCDITYVDHDFIDWRY